MNRYDFSQFYEISVKKLQAEGLDDLMSYAADEIAKSVWEQLPNANIRNCVQIGRLVKNEPNIEMAIVECHTASSDGSPAVAPFPPSLSDYF